MSGGPRVWLSLPLEVKSGRGLSRQRKKIKGWETETMTRLFRLKKKKRRDVGRLPYKNVQYGQEDMGADGSGQEHQVGSLNNLHQ